ncbi:MAG: long-chain fatty acid--CoA ligase [Acetobacteraceae bacterium]|nr:long-chain fatty acid--CoA ligase [Acetobacteraceae bacterium]
MIGEEGETGQDAQGHGDVDWLLPRFRAWGERTALVWRDGTLSFNQLCDSAEFFLAALKREAILPGETLAISGDYAAGGVALLIAALLNRNIVVPIASGRREQMLRIAEVTAVAALDGDRALAVSRTGCDISHPLLQRLAHQGSAGLILFSSGSTGESKAAVLDFGALLRKFRAPRRGLTTLVFLLPDHIGGINTLFHVLSNGGTVVIAPARTPDAIAKAIAAHRVQLLPTTPTFIRMMIIADVHRRFDLRSLEVITYGTEPMPPATLAAAREAFPRAKLKQTYGLSELGILPSQSRNSDSLWMKLGTAGYEHRIVDGVLHIRADSPMLGYLNAPAPFDAEGWFNTNDLVEVDGEYVRVVGRRSELINVGGEKVHPTEIEDVLMRIDNVRDATVRARPSPVTGAVVAARITPCRPELPEALRRRIRRFCQENLERFKVPAVIEIVEHDQHGARFKKSRAAPAH